MSGEDQSQNRAVGQERPNGETVTPVAKLVKVADVTPVLERSLKADRRASPAAAAEEEESLTHDEWEILATGRDSVKAKDGAVRNQPSVAEPLPDVPQPPKTSRHGVSHASKAGILTDICRTDRSISTESAHLSSTLSAILSLPHVCHCGCHVALYIRQLLVLWACIRLRRTAYTVPNLVTVTPDISFVLRGRRSLLLMD